MAKLFQVVSDFIMFCHNMFQFIIWAMTLYLIDSYIRTGSPKCWKDALKIAQYEQGLEIIFSYFRLMPSNPITVLK